MSQSNKNAFNFNMSKALPKMAGVFSFLFQYITRLHILVDVYARFR